TTPRVDPRCPPGSRRRRPSAPRRPSRDRDLVADHRLVFAAVRSSPSRVEASGLCASELEASRVAVPLPLVDGRVELGRSLLHGLLAKPRLSTLLDRDAPLLFAAGGVTFLRSTIPLERERGRFIARWIRRGEALRGRVEAERVAHVVRGLLLLRVR